MSFTTRRVLISTRRTRAASELAPAEDVAVWRWLFKGTSDNTRLSTLNNHRSTALGHRYVVEDRADEVVRGLAFRFCFITQDHAMPQHIGADRLDIIGNDVAAPLEQRPRLGREGQVDRRPRAGAEFDKACEIEAVFLRIARGKHNVHH